MKKLIQTYFLHLLRLNKDVTPSLAPLAPPRPAPWRCGALHATARGQLLSGDAGAAALRGGGGFGGPINLDGVYSNNHYYHMIVGWFIITNIISIPYVGNIWPISCWWILGWLSNVNYMMIIIRCPVFGMVHYYQHCSGYMKILMDVYSIWMHFMLTYPCVQVTIRMFDVYLQFRSIYTP